MTFAYLWPYSRVRSRYCPAGLVTRAGRDMRGVSPPLDWPIRLLLRRETGSTGLWGRLEEGWRRWKRKEMEDCFILSLSISHEALTPAPVLTPSPPHPRYIHMSTNYYQSSIRPTTPIDRSQPADDKTSGVPWQNNLPNIWWYYYECNCFGVIAIKLQAVIHVTGQWGTKNSYPTRVWV